MYKTPKKFVMLLIYLVVNMSQLRRLHVFSWRACDTR